MKTWIAKLVQFARHWPLLVAAWVGFGLPVGSVAAPQANNAEASGQPPVYAFGVVPQFEQRKLFRNWRPVLDEVERRTGLRFRWVGTPKIPTFERQFLAGKFDFAYVNPYHVVQAETTQGYLPLVRDGGRALQGIIVVPKDSPITSPAQLDGKTMAFPSANALGASMLIRAEILSRFNVTIEPRYVQTHSSVYLHVANKLVAAGGGVHSTLAAQPPAIRDAVRVLHTTTSLPPHPVVAHPRVPEAHRRAVQRALLELAATPKGAALLSGIPMVKMIESAREDYNILKSLNLEAFYTSD